MIGLSLFDRIDHVSYGSEELDKLEFLLKALYHDADETVLGDIPRPLKYASMDIHDSLEVVAKSSAERLFKGTYRSNSSAYSSYTQAKEGKTGRLVKLADMLCVVKKSYQEIEILGNKTLLDTITNLRVYAESMDKPEFYEVFTAPETKVFLKSIFEDVLSYVAEMTAKYLED
jgi:5'-deoxynucleotidase